MFQMMAVLSISTCQAVQSLSANWSELPHEKMSSEKHRVIYNIQQISGKKKKRGRRPSREKSQGEIRCRRHPRKVILQQPQERKVAEIVTDGLDSLLFLPWTG